MENKTFTIQDSFRLMRLLVALDIKDEIKEIFLGSDTTGEVAEKITDQMAEIKGFDLIYLIFTKATTKKAEMQIYAFIAETCGCSVEDVQALDISGIMATLTARASWEEWRSFFLSHLRLMQPNSESSSLDGTEEQ